MKTFYSIIVCLFLTIGFTQAQETAAEWITEAETALAEGRTTDAGSAYSNAAHKQMENGDYEAAAENFKKAAEQFEKDGRIAQANAETTNAAGAYESAARKAADAGDHEKAIELYDKAAEQYDAAGRAAMAEGARRNAESERQHLIVTSMARGTGKTTGHIATLSVTNNSGAPMTIMPQTFYIPSDNRYQSYVGRIPNPVEVAPGETIPVKIIGYCTDVTKPPSNADLPPIEDWVAVSSDGIPQPTTSPVIGDPPTVPEPMNPPGGSVPTEKNPVKVITENMVPLFTSSDIPGILENPGFTSKDTEDDQDIIITWPGTDITVEGNINPDADPTSFAPVIISIVESIEKAGEVIQDDPDFVTPFSKVKDREYEAIVQQTVWITMGALTGESYNKDDFSDKTYEQYSNVTKTPVSSIPEEDKDKLNQGVDEFWDVFMATGVEAKVIKADEPRCKSNGVTFDIKVTAEFGGLEIEIYSASVSSKIDEINIPEQYFEKDAEFSVKISELDANCFCECEGEDNKECEFYPNPDEKGDFTKPDTSKPGKIRISRIHTNNTSEVEAKEFEGVDEFEVTLSISDDKEKDFRFKFNVSGYCMVEGCKRAKITDEIDISFIKLIEE